MFLSDVVLCKLLKEQPVCEGEWSGEVRAQVTKLSPVPSMGPWRR